MIKTRCGKGHEFTPENTYINPKRNTQECRKCHAERELARKRKKTHCLRGHERVPENLYPNGTCKACAIFRATNWNSSNLNSRQKILKKNLWKTRYGLSEEAYDEILQKQDGVCAICKKPPLLNKLFVVDHDHSCCSGTQTCGKCIRGLLHQKCNHSLGIFGDNPDTCRAAADYLENPPAKFIVSKVGQSKPS